MALATDDIPRLHQLIRQGLKEGAGISAIINKIEQALSGVYQARGYNDLDYDIALLVLRLGGRKLLYALNQHISIPSIRALRHARRVITQLMPSIGTPKLSDIQFNIRSIFASKIDALDHARPFRTGMSIFWDEVNEEDVACYFPHLDSVGGLCREHSHSLNVRITNFDNAVTIARALADGTVHYGKEASVIALGSFGTILRGAFPVLVSPTCKRDSSILSCLSPSPPSLSTPPPQVDPSQDIYEVAREYLREIVGDDDGGLVLPPAFECFKDEDTGHTVYRRGCIS
jgi:hypothetical protein